MQEPDAITFGPACTFVDAWQTVSEVRQRSVGCELGLGNQDTIPWNMRRPVRGCCLTKSPRLQVEIARAMVGVQQHHGGMLLEGAAGMTVACAQKYFQREKSRIRGRTGVVICCGGNISDERFAEAQALAASSHWR